jgi:type VI secretion system protein VasD
MWLAFYAVIFVLVSGCTSSSHNDPSRYNLQFQAHPQINDSAPLKVRVLLLKSDADFMSSDFYSLQNNASTTLGANLLNSDVFFLMPGQLSKTLSGQSSPDARYIGVMAEYQALDGKNGAFHSRCLFPAKTLSISSGSGPQMNSRPTSFWT